MAQQNSAATPPAKGLIPVIIVAWLWVGLPLIWGVIQTLHKAADLFK